MTDPITHFETNYRWLSNFYPCEIVYQRVVFPSSEHAYQAAKTLDMNSRVAIAHLPTPGDAKKMGQNVVMRPDWNEVKMQVMEDILRLKFPKEPGPSMGWTSVLTQKLIATGDAELIEGNWWHDNTWGQCSCAKCKDITGQNLLGKVLMKIREDLKILVE